MSKMVLPRGPRRLGEQCASSPVSCHVIQEKWREGGREGREERGENIERQDLGEES